MSGKTAVRVVAPVPAFPLDPLIRIFKPHFRPARAVTENQGDLPVDHPRFLSCPGVLKTADGLLYFASILSHLKRLKREFPFDLIDSHFSYPDGVAAALLSSRFGVPFTVTLRGTEVPHSGSLTRRIQIRWALGRCAKVICVSSSLASIARESGVSEDKIRVIPNGVNTLRFRPLDRVESRRKLGLSEKSIILLSVGGLVERKGYHRVIEIIPRLKSSFDNLVYLIVGGPSVEGDISRRLKTLVNNLNLGEVVRFEGPRPPEDLPVYYSAADLFVLATSNEGWANVLLESLACGTPVVTTDVGGNKEVVCRKEFGTIVPFGDDKGLYDAISKALRHEWDQAALVKYASRRSWDKVAEEVISVFREVVDEQKTALPRLG